MKGVTYSHNVTEKHLIIDQLHNSLFLKMPFKDGLIIITDQEEERIGNQHGKLMVEKRS